jgi:hypothetical protein
MDMNGPYSDDFIRKKIRNLDNTYPETLENSDVVWEKIVTKKKRATAWKFGVIRFAASISFVVIIGISWWITHREATTPASQTAEKKITVDDSDVLNYINQLCTGNSIACKSPEFKELQNDLQKVLLKLNEVNTQIALFGDDANLLKAKARIEHSKVKVVKAMIQAL